jgi:hypothetical protein
MNGILCYGELCEPEIRGNIIESNRKAGIKLTDKAVALIGGTSKEDVKTLPSYKSATLLLSAPGAVGDNLRSSQDNPLFS